MSTSTVRDELLGSVPYVSCFECSVCGDVRLASIFNDVLVSLVTFVKYNLSECSIRDIGGSSWVFSCFFFLLVLVFVFHI